MTSGPGSPPPRGKLDRQVDLAMDAARLFVAVVARSAAEAEGAVSLPQLRILVMVHGQGQLNLGAVAAGLGVHPSTASRACDPLVRQGLLSRGDHPQDRRNLALTLTDDGDRVVESMLEHRRRAVKAVLQRMPASRRGPVTAALAEFAAAAEGSVPTEDMAALGWPH